MRSGRELRHSMSPAYSQVLASRTVGIPINTRIRESEASVGTYSCGSKSGNFGHKYLWHRSEGVNTCTTDMFCALILVVCGSIHYFYSMYTTLHPIYGGYSTDKA
jgi:hypothetical protein